jgi:Ca2+-binding EF-hand superfamily protein
MRPTPLISLTLLLALAVPAAQAQTQPARKPAAAAASTAAASGASPLLAQLDTDHDGRISRAEWKGNDVSFQMLDKNGDGFLTADELTPAAGPAAPQDPALAAAQRDHHRASRESLFRWMDQKHDGRLTRAEWKGDPKEFDRYDRNHDGVVTREEFLQP